MKPKTFVSIIATLLGIFVILNLLIWKLYTENLLTYKTGDLSRMGYIADVTTIRKPIIDLPRKHIDLINFKGEKFDVLTIGDSFSAGGVYQDYIATFNNFNVLNIPFYENNILMVLSLLINSGWIDQYKPRIIIIERVERDCSRDFGKTLDFSKTADIEDVNFYYNYKEKNKSQLPKVHFINNGNFKYLLYNMMYRFSDNAFFSEVYIKELRMPLFTTGRKLLFYEDDIGGILRGTDESIEKINENLNYMAETLKRKNIKLYFMPVVDKYDLYYDYIINNSFPRSVFFERLRSLPKEYDFIDTKNILSNELKKGEQDIFYPDDTHWSWKASKRIFETVKFE